MFALAGRRFSAECGIKNALLSALASPQVRAGSVSAQAISSIAALELPRNEWPDLISIWSGDEVRIEAKD